MFHRQVPKHGGSQAFLTISATYMLWSQAGPRLQPLHRAPRQENTGEPVEAGGLESQAASEWIQVQMSAQPSHSSVGESRSQERKSH